jgi:hypothetical protein
MSKTLPTLNNSEAKIVSEILIADISDQIPVILDSITVDENESYNFISMLKQMNSNNNEETRELLSFLLGIGSQDLDLHIQEIIDETINSEE